MINLITGVPGAGKTAYGLKFMLDMTKEGRKLFVHGIPQLKIPHIDVYCDSPNCDVCGHFTEEDKLKMHPAETWHEWAPDGAVLFFDEVQNIYRPRASSAKPPPSIQAFEVHRHRGLDFYLISQSPKLFDTNIRQLISRHIHLKSNWAGRYQFEWPECKDNVQSTSDAVKSSYKLDSKVFALYHSASMHTKQRRKLPAAVYVVILCVIGGGVLATRVYSRISDTISPEQSGGDALADTTQSKRQFPLDNLNSNQKIERNNTRKLDFEPEIRGVLESAPAYSQIVVVKDFPRISACIAGNGKCTCYTQQMTVYPTTMQQCLSQIDRDIMSFNPYLDPQEKQQQQTTQNNNSTS